MVEVSRLTYLIFGSDVTNGINFWKQEPTDPSSFDMHEELQHQCDLVLLIQIQGTDNTHLDGVPGDDGAEVELIARSEWLLDDGRLDRT